jgi:hypothetical protein
VTRADTLLHLPNASKLFQPLPHHPMTDAPFVCAPVSSNPETSFQMPLAVMHSVQVAPNGLFQRVLPVHQRSCLRRMKTYHDTYDRLDYPQPMASGSRSRPAWLQEALNDDLRDPAEVPRSWRAPVLPPPSSSRSRQVPLPEPGRRRGYTIPQSRGDVRDDLDVRPHPSAHLRSARSQGNIRTPPSWTRSAGIDGRPGARPPPEGWDAQTASTASTSSKGNDKKYQVRSRRAQGRYSFLVAAAVPARLGDAREVVKEPIQQRDRHQAV